MHNPMHFDALADQYAEARPPYPHALWERLTSLGVLERGFHAADLGAGTGQVTGPLLEAGLNVVAVEPGPELARRLRAGHPDAQIVVSRAEDADLPEGALDLAVAATSIHWMDLELLLPKVHRWLKPAGRFAVWRTVFGDPDARVTPFRQRIQEIVARRPQRASRVGSSDGGATASALSATGHFRVQDISTFRWSINLDAHRVHGLFSTFSDWSATEVAEAVTAVQELGGLVTEHYLTWLILLAPRRSRARE